jgi:predicted amidohydrolase
VWLTDRRPLPHRLQPQISGQGSNIGHLEILSSALAIMNQCYVLLSNSSDPDMASSSAIISPDGGVIMDDSKEVIEGTIDFREIKKMRRYIVMD